MSDRTAIEYIDVVKRFDGNDYDSVKKVSLSIKEGEFVAILGTSGSGKTTLLKLTNLIYPLTSGNIKYFGEPIESLPVNEYRRKLGYVIQQSGLFPHKTIAENIATVPKLLKWPKAKIKKRIIELLELVQLDPEIYYNRYPRQLSGGQQQRVGIARALAADPSVLLMDEPFGAIDAITRENLQDELKTLQEKLKNTILFVTHDVNEAFKLGHRVIIMDKGEVQQFDTPANIVLNPKNEFVKKLIRTGDYYDKLRVLPVTEFLDPVTDSSAKHISWNKYLSDVLKDFISSGISKFIVDDAEGNPQGEITYGKLQNIIKNCG